MQCVTTGMSTLRTRAAATAALTLLALAGCSSGSNDSLSVGDRESAGRLADSQLDGADNGATLTRDEDGPATPGKAGRAAVQTRAVIATGTVTVVDDDLAEVRNQIDRLLGRYGGYVSDEATFNTPKGGTTSSRLTLRVPIGHFNDVIAAFPTFTTVREAHTTAEDVTTEVIDVESRIRTQEISLQRLRKFLSQTSDIDTLIRLESEIAQREAQLESAKAQQKYLRDQTSLGTITVTLQTPGAKPKKDDPLAGAGFFTGLGGGWNALSDVALVAATVVGAVIPFAVLGALAGVPAWLALRRRRRTTPVDAAV